MTLLSVALLAQEPERVAAELERLRAAGAELLELRAARPDPALLRAVLGARGELRVLAALAAAAPGDARERMQFFAEALRGGVDFVEIELAEWEQGAALRAALAPLLARGPGQLIVASEAPDGRTDELERCLRRLRAVAEAGALALRWPAQSVLDAVVAARLALEPPPGDPRPLLAVPGGEQGRLARLLGAKLGAPYTTALLAGGADGATGTPALAELRELYRWHGQRPHSAVFGVIGWPVGHSLSPALHNAGFAAIGSDARYVPLPVQPTREALFGALDALRALGPLRFCGASVTIPHKEHALQYVRERGGALDELSAHIGAINTVLVREDGSLAGLNSDYLGAIAALGAGLGGGAAALRGLRASVLGAGGAAAAIVAGLSHCGAHTTVYNRSRARADALARRFDRSGGPVRAADWDERSAGGAQLYVNCTPLGMHPNLAASPLPETLPLDPQCAVFDTIYNPLETALLRHARRSGARAISGLEMFVAQAGVQFERFCGAPAPLELFRRVALQRLSS